MTHSEPTDDLGLSPEFLADEDVARDEDNYDGPYGRRRCTCGYRAAMSEADAYDHDDYPLAEVFAGCAGCDPVMMDCKPHGFGIEKFEDPALAQANAAMWAEIHKRPDGKYTSAWLETWGMYAGRHLKGVSPTRSDIALRDMLWRVWSRQSARRLRHSEIVWDRLCDSCETHSQAVEAYERWAKRAVTVRYRDE